MAKCMMCGESGWLLKVTEEGLCSPCELERLVSDKKDFFISKIYHTYLPSNYIFFLALDDKHKRFALSLQSVSKRFKIYLFHYSDLIDFDYTENKTIDNVYNSMMVRLFFNSLRHSQMAFYVINRPTQYGNKRFNRSVRKLNEIKGLLHYIRHNGRLSIQKEQAVQPALSQSSVPIPKLSP